MAKPKKPPVGADSDHEPKPTKAPPPRRRNMLKPPKKPPPEGGLSAAAQAERLKQFKKKFGFKMSIDFETVDEFLEVARQEGLTFMVDAMSESNRNKRFIPGVVMSIKRILIRSLALSGHSQDFIAAMFGITKPSLVKNYSDQLQIGAAGADAMVEATLYDMATSGKNFDATKFWLERRVRDVWAPPVVASEQVQQGANVLFATRSVSLDEWVKQVATATDKSISEVMGDFAETPETIAQSGPVPPIA